MTQAHGERRFGANLPLLLEEGACCLVKGKVVEPSYRLVMHLSEEGVPCLCASRLYPDRIRSKYGIEKVTRWWISHSPGEGNFDPSAVGTLASAIQEFIDQHPNGCVVLLDGLEYITVNIGFTKSLFFVEHLNEYVMPRRATILMPVDPECFEPKEFARLERFTESLDGAGLRDALDTFEMDHDLLDG